MQGLTLHRRVQITRSKSRSRLDENPSVVMKMTKPVSGSVRRASEPEEMPGIRAGYMRGSGGSPALRSTFVLLCQGASPAESNMPEG